MPETKLKNSGLLTLAEMSVQPSIDCILWLFFSFFCRSIKKRSKLHKEKDKINSLRRKGAPGSVMELDLVLNDIKTLKKSLMLNGIKGAVNPGKYSTLPSF